MVMVVVVIIPVVVMVVILPYSDHGGVYGHSCSQYPRHDHGHGRSRGHDGEDRAGINDYGGSNDTDSDDSWLHSVHFNRWRGSWRCSWPVSPISRTGAGSSRRRSTQTGEPRALTGTGSFRGRSSSRSCLALRSSWTASGQHPPPFPFPSFCHRYLIIAHPQQSPPMRPLSQP